MNILIEIAANSECQPKSKEDVAYVSLKWLIELKAALSMPKDAAEKATESLLLAAISLAKSKDIREARCARRRLKEAYQRLEALKE